MGSASLHPSYPLTISKKLVELMNGAIWVESEPGQGSNFIFVAEFGKQGEDEESEPGIRKEADETWAQATASKQLGSIKGMKVLLVDDSMINQQVTREILETEGAIIEIAGNGKEAIQTIEDQTFDVVLMDIEMSEMDGYEATRRVRNNPKFKNLPIIAMTGHAFEGCDEKYLEAGMSGHMTKPVEPDELLATLSNIISISPNTACHTP